MTQQLSWRTTTHEWAWDVDRHHLESMRNALAAPGAAGGRRHLILEVLAYAQDEAAATGRLGNVAITYQNDGTVTVDDDGRGTDTRVDADGRMIRKPVMATADVRFADPTVAPRLPDGLPRRGMSSVASLSEVLVHENHRSNGSWSQTYRYGIPDAALAPVEPRPHSGTVVTFHATLDGPERLTPEDVVAFPDLHVECS